MRCYIEGCIKTFKQEESVYLSKDPNDKRIYCEEHAPEGSLLLSQGAAINVIAGRNSKQQEDINNKKEKKDVVETQEPVIVEEKENVEVSSITFQVVKQTKPEIDFKFLFVKDNLKKALKKYEGLVVTEENLPQVKDDNKSLSALKNDIKRFRIDQKKILMKPIEEMENNLKELEGLVDSVQGPIKAGLDVFKEKANGEKLIKVQGWLSDAYIKYNIRKEFQTVEVTHTTKKKDVEALVESQYNLQLEKDNQSRVNQETHQENIDWIKKTVAQNETNYDITMNVQKYLDKLENGVDIKSIMTDISTDARDIVVNAEAAVAKADENVIEEHVEVVGAFDRQEFNRFSEKLESGDVDVETGEVVEKEETLEEPVTYRFRIDIVETEEKLVLLKNFLDSHDMNYNGELVEESEEE